MGRVDPIDARFGDRVARVRAARGFSQQRLADAILMPRSAVSDIERGKRPPVLSEAVRIANVLEVGLDAMLSSEPLVLTVRTPVE